MQGLLAHVAPELVPSDAGELAMTIVLVLALVVPLVLLGVVAWIFWKAKVREETEQDDRWRSAPSS